MLNRSTRDVVHDLISRRLASVVLHSTPGTSSTGAVAPMHEDWTDEELKVHARVHEHMMHNLLPTMHASVGPVKDIRGEYPMAYTSYIGFVVAQDQHSFDYFILNCRVPTAATTLVTRIEHLLSYEEVKRNIAPYAECDFGHFQHMGASVWPSFSQGHMQFSAQFPSGIVLPDTKTTLSFHATCQGHATRTVCVRGDLVYSAFRAQCAERGRAMPRLRSLVGQACNAQVFCKFNPLPGHKIYLYDDEVTGSPCNQLILYVVQKAIADRDAKRGGKSRCAKKKGKAQLCVLAVDASLDMRDELMHAAVEYDECAICMEPIEQLGACWRCCHCGNRVHHPCMEKWKMSGTTCPFCRGALTD